MENSNNLRDFLYLDLDKVSSIFSQLTGGLVTGTEITTGKEKDERNIRKYDLKIFTPEFGGAETQSSQLVERRVMHHDLFNRVERLLFEKDYALDINESIKLVDVKSGEAHKKFNETFYVRCTGWPIFEDYDKMKTIGNNHNKLMKFINNSALSTLKDSQEYKDISFQIETAKNEVKKERDRNKKALKQKQIATLEKSINQLLDGALCSKVDEWITEGFSHWVDTFIKDAIYFHIYPFEESTDFHVKATLKRNCYVDGSTEYTDFAYTGRPNIKLTLFGLVTSIPPKGEHPFDPMVEFQNHIPKDEKDDPKGFESAFRGLFRGFDGLDNLSKFERYPNITIYPLAIFRDIYPNK